MAQWHNDNVSVDFAIYVPARWHGGMITTWQVDFVPAG